MLESSPERGLGLRWSEMWCRGWWVRGPTGERFQSIDAAQEQGLCEEGMWV